MEANRVSTHDGSASPDMSTAVNAATKSTETKVANTNLVRRALGLLGALFGSTLDSITDPSCTANLRTVLHNSDSEACTWV
jgi:hypothetical protein